MKIRTDNLQQVANTPQETDMKTFFCIILLLSVTVVAEETAIKIDQPDNQAFLKACQDGFDHDYSRSSESMRLGSGKFTLLYSQRTPPTFKCQQPQSEGNLPVPQKEPLSQLRKEASQSCAKEKREATWFAFRDNEGILNIAINAKLDDYEKSLIWRTESDGRGWEAWSTHILGPTHWLETKEVRFTWLALGPIGRDPEELQRKLQVLADLKIVEIPAH